MTRRAADLVAPALVGLYHPGTSWLHRLGPGAKAAGLAASGIAVVLARGPGWAIGLLAAACAVAASAHLPLRTTARGLVPVLVTAALVGGYQVWQRDWTVGVEVAADLVTAVLAAAVVTATTPADRMLDAVASAVRPLRRLGASPDGVPSPWASCSVRCPPWPRPPPSPGTQPAPAVWEVARVPCWYPPRSAPSGRARLTGEALAARGLGD